MLIVFPLVCVFINFNVVLRHVCFTEVVALPYLSNDTVLNPFGCVFALFSYISFLYVLISRFYQRKRIRFFVYSCLFLNSICHSSRGN